MNEVYAEVGTTLTLHISASGATNQPIYLAQFFPKDRFPARTCVGVASLPLGAAVEIECVAEVSEFWNQVPVR